MSYNEYKYVIELDRVPYAVALLESMYDNTDPYPHGTVNSLYYDSVNLALYEQCIGGNEFKAKYRVRWYDGGVYQAQIKDKDVYGVSKLKSRLPFAQHTPVARFPMLWHDLPFNDTEQSARDMQLRGARIGPLYQLAHIRYYRRRYRSFDFRMNIDSNIELETNARHPLGLISKIRIPLAVLEIKTKQERPILPFLGALKLRQDSFSKYALGMKMLFREPDALNRYLVIT
jgi:hypothetical protein